MSTLPLQEIILRGLSQYKRFLREGDFAGNFMGAGGQLLPIPAGEFQGQVSIKMIRQETHDQGDPIRLGGKQVKLSANPFG